MNLTEHDQQQRQLALDIAQSFIVQAPAGSGKTELLIQRFLNLLSHANTPEEIVAITFTKKAANEMRTRIIHALKQAASAVEPAHEHGKKTWVLARHALARDQQMKWNIINNPNQLRIQTIDSLCSYLARQSPLLSQFGMQPTISNHADALYRKAAEETLMYVEDEMAWSQAIAQLLLHVDNDFNHLHDLLIDLLKKRDQWLSYIHLDQDQIALRKQLEFSLAAVIQEKIIAINHYFPKEYIAELLAIARFAADHLEKKNKIHIDDDLTNKDTWLKLADLLLTQDHQWRKKVDKRQGFPAKDDAENTEEKKLFAEYKSRHKQLIEALQTDEHLRALLASIFLLPNDCYDDTQWELLKSLLYVLKVAAAQLRIIFQQYGEIDFIENAQAALAVLGSEDHPTDLALMLDYQIRHILMDEFQDTSYSQYQLLEKLTWGWEADDGRTLFIVGDPMQSIYRFREAEVKLFLRMKKNGIGQLTLTPIQLSVNFRSHSAIVDWNNQHFQAIFPETDDMVTGAISYHDSVARIDKLENKTENKTETKTETSENTPAVGVSLINLPAEKTNAAQHITAFITLIKQLKQHHPQDKIAILVRTRTQLKILLPALKKENIIYHAVDIEPLTSKQLIQDLFSLTAALLHLADRIAWLAILRAPWCGLTLADLLMIAGDSAHAVIWQQLQKQEIQEKLSIDGQQRLNKILPILQSKLAERDRYSLRQWIETTWLLLGGPACVQQTSDLEDANAFFKLLEEIDEHPYEHRLNTLQEKIKKLFASAQTDDTSLQMMTIHSAKGLEFDTVILPYLEGVTSKDDKQLLAWMEHPLPSEQMALLLAPIHATGADNDAIYQYIRHQQAIRADYEIDRLLYVAATRAKSRLYLLFSVNCHPERSNYHLEQSNCHLEQSNCHPEQSEGSLERSSLKITIAAPGTKINKGSFLEKLWPLIQHEAHSINLFSEKIINPSPENDETKKHFISRLKIDWQNPITETKKTQLIFHRQQTGFQLRDLTASYIGIVTHRCLQLMAQHSIAWWQQQTIAQQYHYLQLQLMQQGMLKDHVDGATKTIRAALQQTITDKRGQWILQAHREAQSEFALTAVIDNKIQQLVIDRTFIDEQDTRWIVDYKTSTLPDGSQQTLTEFLENEKEKYAEKMQYYRRATELWSSQSRPIRLGLYFPMMSAWKEWSD